MSEQAIPEGWRTSSGLALDDADVTIDSVVYRYDADYNNGETLVAVVSFTNDDNGEEGEQFFPCGKGWEPADKGNAARHESGKDGKTFNKNSGWGEFIDSAIKVGALPTLQERASSMTDASAWTGLKFHVESQERTFKIRGEEEPRVTTRIVATAFLGAGDDNKKASKGKSEKPAEKAESKSESTSNGNGEIDAKLKAKLTALAKKHDTHDAFMEEAFGLDGVMGDSHLEELVSDPDKFYTGARGHGNSRGNLAKDG